MRDGDYIVKRVRRSTASRDHAVDHSFIDSARSCATRLLPCRPLEFLNRFLKRFLVVGSTCIYYITLLVFSFFDLGSEKGRNWQ
jgi:hypothetical protein